MVPKPRNLVAAGDSKLSLPLAAIKTLTEIGLDGNKFSGKLPSLPASLTSLNIANEAFRGELVTTAVGDP